MDNRNQVPLRSCFADLHVHIGRSQSGQAIKISGSKELTFRNIAKEASERKGIELIGIIDCHSPAVQEDILDCLESGEMEEAEGGGIRYRDTTILLGAEMEVRDEGGGPYHLLAYLPDLAAMQQWTAWMSPYLKNINLSSQRIRVTGRELQAELLSRGGMLAVAHAFTPHRGLLGCSADTLGERLNPDGIAAIELGLSADTEMAGHLSQLDRYPFLTNSDAHSTGMLGRECNELRLAKPSFQELRLALLGQDGRGIAANYGLHPQLGKYHTSYCSSCKKALSSDDEIAGVCLACGNVKLVRGVSGRIRELADRECQPQPDGRPPYIQQVPLNFFPGIGPVMRERLFQEVGTEMELLHRIPIERIASVMGEKIAGAIALAREGRATFLPGSGGSYGSMKQS
jgi:uncharacterized protein (TIGR00375 family)